MEKNDAIAPGVMVNDGAQSLSADGANKTLLTVTYGLYIGGVFIFVLAIVAIILNHVKKSDLTGSAHMDHLLWQMRTFWWSALWLAGGLVATVGSLFTFHFPVGFIIYIGIAIWYLYRNIRGLLRLLDGKPAY